MEVFCGIDWAEDHHDIALVDRDGALLALLAEHGDHVEDPIPVAIETPRGC